MAVEEVTARAVEIFIKSGRYPLEYGLLTEIMQASGSRPRAVLSLTGRDCTRDGRVVIRQGKGSATLSCVVWRYRHFIAERAGKDIPLFCTLDYYTYRRACLREGILSRRVGYKYRNICSAFREQVARSVATLTGDVKDAAQVVGHRSVASTAHYIGESKKEVKELTKNARK